MNLDIDMVIIHCVSGSEIRDLMKFLSEQMYVNVNFGLELGCAVTKDYCSQWFDDICVNRGFRLSVDTKMYHGSLPIDAYIKCAKYPIIPFNEFMSGMCNNDDLCKSDYSIDYLFL